MGLKLITLITSTLLATGLPFFHPESEIVCSKYLPGTNTRVPRGVIYRYSPEQWRDNQMRCFCEVVKATESMCVRGGYGEDRCAAKTQKWVKKNFPVIDARSGAGPNQGNVRRQNFILNMQINP